MIIKVLDDNLNDRFLIEAAYIRWCNNGSVMEVHIVAKQTKTARDMSLTSTRIESEPSLRLRINHGDRVFIMNDEGRTIDSRRIELHSESESSRDKDEALKLLRAAWNKNPKDNLLQLLGSCFAAGDISGIDDAELKDNLKTLIDL